MGQTRAFDDVGLMSHFAPKAFYEWYPRHARLLNARPGALSTANFHTFRIAASSAPSCNADDIGNISVYELKKKKKKDRTSGLRSKPEVGLQRSQITLRSRSDTGRVASASLFIVVPDQMHQSVHGPW
jgi:hypothetical protein